MFLLKLAWQSRYRLPLILTVGFMALDIRMQLEINIHTRRVQRMRRPGPPLPNIFGAPNENLGANQGGGGVPLAEGIDGASDGDFQHFSYIFSFVAIYFFRLYNILN